MTLTRRALLAGAGTVGAASVIGVPFLAGLSGASSTGELLPSRRPLPQRFTMAFKIPCVLAPARTDATGDHYEIVQRVAWAEILPGVRTRIWGYNGLFPGPTIVSTRGRPTTVTHRNELPVPVVVHLHGGHTPPEHDGYPIDLLYPATPGPARTTATTHEHGDANVASGTRTYVYPLQQRAATLWYHDHRMDFTGPTVWRGLAGFHLVRDPSERRLRLPEGDRDLPIMIMDRSFDADGSLRYPSTDMTLLHTPGVHEPYQSGVLGDVILVNGVPWPVAEVPAVRHHLRLLNASNARRYRLALDPAPPVGGPALIQIGTDGGLLPHPIAQDGIELAPGQRCDIVVDFGRYHAGQRVVVRNEFGDGGTAEVMRFDIIGTADDSSRIPDALVAADQPATVAAVRTMHFRHGTVNGALGWTINGQPFDPKVSQAQPRLGTTEIWRLTSDFHHPVHLHLTHFRVLSRGISGPGPQDHGLKDTIDLRPAEQATILVPFDGYAGRYVFHCHNLEHEDMAMMGNFTTMP